MRERERNESQKRKSEVKTSCGPASRPCFADSTRSQKIPPQNCPSFFPDKGPIDYRYNTHKTQVHPFTNTMAGLRQRSTITQPSSTSTPTTSSRSPVETRENDPSSKQKRNRRSPCVSVALVMTLSGFVVFGMFTTVLTDDYGTRRSLRSVLGGLGLHGLAHHDNGPIHYSKLPLCINHYDDMPELWRPPFVTGPDGTPKRLFMNEQGAPQASHPWTEHETQLATRALQSALEEIIHYYHTEMTTQELMDFQPDGINSLLDMVYSQKGHLYNKALKAARDQFILVATPFVNEESPDDKEGNENNSADDGDDDDDDDNEGDRDEENGQDNENEIEIESDEGDMRKESETNDSEDEDEDGDEEIESKEGEEDEHEDVSQQEELEDESNEEKDEEQGEDESTEEQEEMNRDDEKQKYEKAHRRLLEDTDDNLESGDMNVPLEDSNRCRNQYFKMKMLDYGHYIVEQYGREIVREEDPELETAYRAVVNSVREMIEFCGTLDRILKLNITSELFEDPDEDSDIVFDYLLSAIALVEFQTIPEIDLPKPSSDWFVANLWKYLATYHLKYARDNPRHYWDPDTMDHAWLATHIAYLPSGYGRHTNKVQDAPYLYQYIRENFYYAMEHGRIDLVSEFVDLIRTYGCSEETDYQLRDGTRFVIKQFYEEMASHWIDLDSTDSHYNKIHIPWAGSAAVMLTGESDPVVPGSYGYAFYSILRNHQRTEQMQMPM